MSHATQGGRHGDAMKLGYVCSGEEGLTGRLLDEVARHAATGGMPLAGAVQPPDLAGAQGKCRIVLRILPEGLVRDVSQDLAPGEEGCRLDTGALEEAAALVEARIAGASALIVNKFGKQEAVGRGFVGAIGQACAAGLPVLIGVAPVWHSAFLAFTENAAEPLPPEPAALLDWLRRAAITPPPAPG